jgi:hypothetical protein
MVTSSSYQHNATKCVRLAEQTKDYVLSVGYMKMAEAWLDLADRRSRKQPTARAPRKQAGSRSIERRSKSPGRRTVGGKPAPMPRRKRRALSH